MATASEIKAFINRLGALAVAESNRRIAAGKGFVLPSVCIAQSALETGWGDSGLMTRANAFFGIKAGGAWTGKVYTADTWEVADGQAYNTTANFRAYDSLEESVADYYDLIGNSSRYSKALSYGLNTAEWKTPKECITAIWSGGYATDTLYVEKIMSTINARNLAVFDGQIDGVTFSSTVPDTDKTFTHTDLVDGSYYISDSGRSISIEADTGHVVIALNAIPTIASTTTYQLVLQSEYVNSGELRAYVYRLVGDSPTMDSIPYEDGDTITLNEGEKIYIEMFYESSPLMIGTLTSIKLNAQVLNDGSEISASALAFFVKIE